MVLVEKMCLLQMILSFELLGEPARDRASPEALTGRMF